MFGSRKHVNNWKNTLTVTLWYDTFIHVRYIGQQRNNRKDNLFCGKNQWSLESYDVFNNTCEDK